MEVCRLRSPCSQHIPQARLLQLHCGLGLSPMLLLFPWLLPNLLPEPQSTNSTEGTVLRLPSGFRCLLQ